MEFIASNVQYNGCLPDSARTGTRAEALRSLPFRVCSKLHRAWSCKRFLDLAVCAVQAAWTGWYRVHCAPEAAADLPALVSPHYGADVFVVLVHRVHRLCPLVHRDELLRALCDVLVLCPACPELQASPFDRHGDHHPSADSNGRWLCHQHLGPWLPANGRQGQL